jgi:hypothetical protein
MIAISLLSPQPSPFRDYVVIGEKVIPNPSISLRVNSVRNLKFLILRCSRFLGFPRNDKNTNYDTASKGRRERGKICERLTSPRLVNSQGLIGKKLTH